MSRVRLAKRKGVCTWCKGPVLPPRKTWCSDGCVHLALLCTDASYARAEVLKRDQGICAGCGLDCEDLRRQIARSRWKDVWPEAQAVLRALGFVDSDVFRTLWEADHIVPVSEGGGLLGLSNLRTLCLACHRQETAVLAGRHARQRRESAEENAGA